jgi:hypothetical protein
VAPGCEVGTGGDFVVQLTVFSKIAAADRAKTDGVINPLDDESTTT